MTVWARGAATDEQSSFQTRIEAVFKELGDTLEAICWADDLIEPDKLVDEDDEVTTFRSRHRRRAQARAVVVR
jgi:hypothetical protein